MYLNSLVESECCGCTACEQICPRNCIQMRKNEEGFLYPVVNNDKCIKCGLCEKVCPFGNYQKREQGDICYYGWHKDENVRSLSTSGAAFIAISEMCKKKGFTHFYGAAYPSLESARNDIVAAYLLLEESYENGGKLLVAGNGGSAADAEHIVGELMKGFKMPRKPESTFAEKLVAENQELGAVLAENLQGALPAIALDGHPALSTAYMNDCEPLLCFAQQVNGYGKSGDVFLGISTSGNSKNVLYAATTAHAKGMKVIGLTGAKDSKLKDMSDVCIKAPQTETYMIQELHLPIYHCLCLMLEDKFFAETFSC